MLKKKATLLFPLCLLLIFISNCSVGNNALVSLTAAEINDLSKEITVSIEGSVPGSGVIAAFDEGQYYVITSEEVVKNQKSIGITTRDGQKHSSSGIVKSSGDNLALVLFPSNENYLLAEFQHSRNVRKGDSIFITGVNAKGSAISERRHQFSPGEVISKEGLNSKSHSIEYTNRTLNGMVGGPVLNEYGSVVGIHNSTDSVISIQPFIQEARTLLPNVQFITESENELYVTKKAKRDWELKIKEGRGVGDLKIDKSGHLYILAVPNYSSEGHTLSRIDNNGNLLWEQTINPTIDLSIDIPSRTRQNIPDNILLTQPQNVYLTGTIPYLVKKKDGLALSVEKHTSWLAKVKSDGSINWEKELEREIDEGQEYSSVLGWSPDVDGNLYGVGREYYNLDKNVNRATSSVYKLVKVDSEGNISWIRFIEEEGVSRPKGVLFSNDSIYVVGESEAEMPSERDSSDVWITKFDKNSSFLWTRHLRTPHYDSISGIHDDAEGNLYLWGETSGSLMQFKPNEVVTSSEREQDPESSNFWIVSYGKDGTLRWKNQLVNNTTGNRPIDLTIDTASNVYIFYSELKPESVGVENAEKQKLNLFIRKYDTAGNLQWIEKLEIPKNVRVNSIKSFEPDSIYLSGKYDYKSWFSQLVGPTISKSYLRDYGWVAKYSRQ